MIDFVDDVDLLVAPHPVTLNDFVDVDLRVAIDFVDVDLLVAPHPDLVLLVVVFCYVVFDWL